jgi:antimicrobial peptide system SdpB family protein
MLNSYILSLEKKNVFTSRIAFARSLIALSSFLLLISNDLHPLMVPVTDLRWVQRFNIFTVLGISVGKITALVVLGCVISGYFPKVTAILQTWVHFSICSAISVIDGGDQVALNLSLLLIPLCFLDTRKNQWHSSESKMDRRKQVNVFASVYYYLIQLQVSVIYLHAAVGKLMKDDWRDGTSLYFWNTNVTFGASGWLEKFNNNILLSSFAPFLAWLVMILELGLFACILVTNNRIKKLFLILGIAFHFLIVVNYGLVTFFFSMSAALILYLDTENYILHQFQNLTTKLISKPSAIS